MDRFDPNLTLRFSLQRALIGEVTRHLTAVTAGLRGTDILLTAYFDRPVTPQDRERIGEIGAEVIADFPGPYTIAEQCKGVDDGAPASIDFWAFKRADEPAGV